MLWAMLKYNAMQSEVYEMKTAIIGGGASGLACAIELKKKNAGMKITVFESNDRVGKKILATGNGRCNLTNVYSGEENYHNFPFARYCLTKYTPESNIEFFNSLGLYTKTDSSGRVYPMSNQASGVLDCLRLSADALGVETVLGYHVDSVKRHGKKFIVGDKGEYDFVVIATGGKAAPAQGSDGSGYKILRALGHSITKLSPSLVQLETKSRDFVKPLKGVRCEVDMTLSLDNAPVCKKHGELLFADYGLSGIVSMEISAYASPYLVRGGKNAEVAVDFVPAYSEDELRLYLKRQVSAFPKKEAQDILSGFLPKKIGQAALKANGISVSGKLSENEIKKVAYAIKNTKFSIASTKDFSFAQVTSGGAATDEFDAKTLESKKVENLYCTGEVLDVDGDCGGYNLNWAWSSGRLVAESIAKKSGAK